MSTSFGNRAVLALSAAVLLFSLAARLHNIAAFPAIYDYDASGTAVYILDLSEGHLPNPASWSGRHPPLYFALGALLWKLLPASMPVHVALRLLSVGAWVATVGLVWRFLRRLTSEADAAVVAVLCLGIPGVVIASCMMTNDTLCALFIVGTLVRLLEAPRDALSSARHASLTGLLAGLAGLTKATGLAAVVTAAVFYAWECRRNPRRAVRQVMIVVLLSTALVGPHYARLLLSVAGSPYYVLGGHLGSQEHEVATELVVAAAPARAHFAAYPRLLHDAIWDDPIALYLPRNPRWPLAVLSWCGVLVLGVAGVGAARLLVRRDIARRSAVALVFGLFYAAALAPTVVAWPSIVLTKVNYFLPEILPAAILLVSGSAALQGRARTALRIVLLSVAAGGVALTWYGWWAPSSQNTRARESSNSPAGSAAAAVERYFEYRADDPIRAMRLVGPGPHLAHELRLLRILRLPFNPAPGSTAADEQSLELARARFAWLELYNLVHWIQPVAAALRPRILDVSEHGDSANVRVAVDGGTATAPPEAPQGCLWPFPPFIQRFTLQRGNSDWQITRVEQSDVSDMNAVPAFVAYPTLAALDHLRDIGWRPDWQNAVASFLHHPQ